MTTLGYQLTDTLTPGLAALRARATDLAPAMADIAASVLRNTLSRFAMERSPDGVPWVKSKRASDQGGRTLYLQGDLYRAIDQSSDATSASIGVIPVGGVATYAAIHQFGGTIRPRPGADGAAPKRALKTPFGPRASVTMPARPYLGLGPEDVAAIDAILTDHLTRLGDA